MQRSGRVPGVAGEAKKALQTLQRNRRVLAALVIELRRVDGGCSDGRCTLIDLDGLIALFQASKSKHPKIESVARRRSARQSRKCVDPSLRSPQGRRSCPPWRSMAAELPSPGDAGPD